MQLKDDFYFVTLTAPTVKARELSNEVSKRYKAFTRIKDNIRKTYGIKLNGLRKTEIEYSELNDWYHPHFHIMIQGYHNAKLVRDLWLKQFKNASVKAQNIRFCDSNDSNNLVEVFKYAVKDVTKDTTTAKAMDIIYSALEGVRTVQTYGSIRKVIEPKESTQEQVQVDWTPPKQEIWVYNEYTADYHDYLDNTLIGTQELL